MILFFVCFFDKHLGIMLEQRKLNQFLTTYLLAVVACGRHPSTFNAIWCYWELDGVTWPNPDGLESRDRSNMWIICDVIWENLSHDAKLTFWVIDIMWKWFSFYVLFTWYSDATAIKSYWCSKVTKNIRIMMLISFILQFHPLRHHITYWLWLIFLLIN